MRSVLAIALTTFREVNRSKIIYALLVAGAAIVSLAYFFGSITIGDQQMVVKDFGLFSISMLAVLFAVISGTSLLAKELGKKTIYNILSKPLSRSSFLIGKFFGLFGTATVCISMMTAALFLCCWALSGTPPWEVIHTAVYITLELAVVSAIAMFFSSVLVTPVLAGLLTAAIFMAGRLAHYLPQLADNFQLTGLPRAIITAIFYVLPHLNDLAVGDRLVFGEAVPVTHLIWSAIYVVGYCGVVLGFACFLFRRREFN